MGKTVAKVQWLVVALLWVYIVYRACSFAITQDEAYSYFLVKTNYWRALPGTANTHWLNTLFIRLFLWLPGGDHPYKLRMLSMVCWWLFAASVIGLSRLFQNKWVGMAFFAAAILNPYLLFYFSLSRGYAAGCAFAMLSLWQAALLIQKEDWRPARWLRVVVPASVAVLANFSFFYFFIGVTSVYFFHLFLTGHLRYLRERSARKWWLLTGVTFVFATGCLVFIKFHSRDLEFVEYPDLIRASFGSLMRYSLYYGASRAPAMLLGMLLFAALILFSSVAGYRWLRQKKMTIGNFSMVVFVVILLLDLVLHALFGVSFLYGRTALVIYVTILSGVFGIIDDASISLRRIKRATPVTMGSFALLLMINFLLRFNIIYFSEWPVQTDTERCLDYLRDANAKKVGMGLWHRDVYIHYYSVAFPGKYSFEVRLVMAKDLRNGSAAICDHLLLTLPDDEENGDLRAWNVEFAYPYSRTLVLARRP